MRYSDGSKQVEHMHVSEAKTGHRGHAVLRPSVVSDSVTPWTVAHQAPLSMGFSSQEDWSGFPFPSPGDLLDPGIKPRSPALQARSLPSEPPRKPTFEWRDIMEPHFKISPITK